MDFPCIAFDSVVFKGFQNQITKSFQLNGNYQQYRACLDCTNVVMMMIMKINPEKKTILKSLITFLLSF
jgi:hypothetical protein